MYIDSIRSNHAVTQYFVIVHVFFLVLKKIFISAAAAEVTQEQHLLAMQIVAEDTAHQKVCSQVTRHLPKTLNP